MKTCIFMLALALPALAGAAEEFTAAEIQHLQTWQAMGEKACRERLTETLESRAEDVPLVTQWVSTITASADYCGCAAKRLIEGITPSMLHAGDTQGIAALGKKAGNECMVPILKSSFPAFCLDLAAEITKRAATDPGGNSAFCQCMQSDVDALNADSYEAFFAEGLQETGRRCGLDKLKGKD